MKFYNQDNPSSHVTVEITDLLLFSDFAAAYSVLGEQLIPNSTRVDVINLYNDLFYYEDEILVCGVSSKMIQDNGVVCIGFKILL